jgi:hypothetical protein
LALKFKPNQIEIVHGKNAHGAAVGFSIGQSSADKKIRAAYGRADSCSMS